MKQYVILSIETHLFFARIMKEHALFLLAAFPEKETDFRKRADWFREKFEEGLKEATEYANGMVGNAVLDSGEIVTKYTQTAECQTCRLTGIRINTEITEAQQQLCGGCPVRISRQTVCHVRMLNRKMLGYVQGLIAFKEEILQKMLSCRLYTANYPLLIEHILREAKLYRQLVIQLERTGRLTVSATGDAQLFWNQIMMEHAQFIRGYLDPTECGLIHSADAFAGDYCRLLEEAKEQSARTGRAGTAQSMHLTEEFQKFKTAGTEGITDCKIRSIILPLLADHVLREANHYLRILGSSMSDPNGCDFGAGKKGRDYYGIV